MPHQPNLSGRILSHVVSQLCNELGIGFRTIDDWIIELTKDGVTRRIVGYQFDINSAGAAAIAIDKVATYQLLTAHQVPAIEHYLVRPGTLHYASYPPTLEGKPIVLKPLRGAGAHGLRLFSSPQAALGYIKSSDVPAWALSPYAQIERETRLIMLDGEILLAYDKIPVIKNGLKLFNLGKGAEPQDTSAEPSLIELAQAAQGATGLRLCAVDCVTLDSGKQLVLEVNSGFMLEHYARSSPEHMNQAQDIYKRILTALFDIQA